MMPVDTPNYTQIPNDILGNILRGNKADPGLMATLEGSELKVLLAVCRLTFGFHQDQRRASITMIQELTGLSRQGVVNAASGLEDKNLIARVQDGGVTLWQVIVNSVDQQESEVVNSVDQIVNSVDRHLRKKPKKKPSLSKKEIPPKTPKPKKPKPTPADIDYYNPLSQELLSVCSLAVPLVNGTKLDFTGVIKFLQANHANPDMVREFGRWYEKIPNLKAITENWKLFIDGKQPRHKQFKNGNGARKNDNQPKPAAKSKYSKVL